MKSKKIISLNQCLSTNWQKIITLKKKCYFESTFKPKSGKNGEFKQEIVILNLL